MNYIEETKLYLQGHSLKNVSELMGCTTQTAKRRIHKTLKDLIDFYEFIHKGIPFPHLKGYSTRDKFRLWQLSECKIHAAFWLNIISDYENGVTNYCKPQPKKDEMLVSELTVVELERIILKAIAEHFSTTNHKAP